MACLVHSSGFQQVRSSQRCYVQHSSPAPAISFVRKKRSHAPHFVSVQPTVCTAGDRECSTLGERVLGQKQSNDPRNNQHNPQYANYWAPLTRKRRIPPHSAQSQHANDWAPRTRKRHQQEHRPQRPTESSDPTQHAKGRTGDCPGPRKGTKTQRNVTRGGGGGNTCKRGMTPHRGVSTPARHHPVTRALPMAPSTSE